VDREPGTTELDPAIAYGAQQCRIGAVPRVPAIADRRKKSVARHPRRSTASAANRIDPAPIRSQLTSQSSDC